MTHLRLPAGLAGMLVRRGVQIVALGLIVGTLCFFVTRSLPGDIAMRVADGRYGYDLVNTAAAANVRAELGLDQPTWLALFDWWGHLLRFDLGTSWVSTDTVWREVSHQMGHTIELAAVAVILSVLVALPLGAWAGLRPRGLLDRATLAASVVLRTMPPFLLSVLLMLVFSVRLGVLPAAGDFDDGSLLLPGLTLGLALAAGLARVARQAMVDVAASPAYEFARTKGLGDLRAFLRHGLRAAALPVVSYLGVQAVFIVEGALVVETLFAWPGIGHAMTHAVFGRDVPMIQGTALAMGGLFVFFNLLVDAACLLLDPRQRREVRAERSAAPEPAHIPSGDRAAYSSTEGQV